MTRKDALGKDWLIVVAGSCCLFLALVFFSGRRDRHDGVGFGGTMPADCQRNGKPAMPRIVPRGFWKKNSNG